jgi:uncharacterized protein (DUF433 family)
VSGGLKAGDRLVVEGLDRLKDGDGVTEQPWKGAPPPRHGEALRKDRACPPSSSTGPCLRGSWPLHHPARPHRDPETPDRPLSQRRAARGQHLRGVSRGHAPDHERRGCRSHRAELSSVKNLLYFESSTDTSGSAEIRITFKPGTHPELAQVDVQNRIKTVEPRLPAVVRQNGLKFESAASSFLMIVGLKATDGQYDEVALSDYLARNVVEELRRVEGVGRVQLFGSERAMRIWVDPARLQSYQLSMGDLSDAITRQNAQIAPGRVGGAPTVAGQRVTIPVTVQGQLQTPEQFAAIVLKASPDGAKVVLGDVARIELGAQTYAESIRENGSPVRRWRSSWPRGERGSYRRGGPRRLAELSASMPAGISYSVPFDTAPSCRSRSSRSCRRCSRQWCWCSW